MKINTKETVMNPELLKKTEYYLSNEEDAFFRDDLQKVIDANDEEELNDRFYRELEFGTAGLRGLIGGGLNRMNTFVVRRATQGLARYLQKSGEPKTAVIAYDSRHFSAEFAKSAALVLAANGIKTFLFTSLRPTPVLSFAIRYLKTTAGIMITASHNPAEYNGYKVFWKNGSQITPPVDTGIIEEVNSVTGEIPTLSEQEAVSKGLLVYTDREVDDAYNEMVKSYSCRPELFASSKDIKIVYTPLNGAGKVPVVRVLKELGLNVILVPEQAEPDGDFPTTPFPNPEIAEAMDRAVSLAQKEKADLVLGTDPDSDRIGIAVPLPDGRYQLVTGNQFGCILAYYLLSFRREKGLDTKPAGVVKTIVSTNLIDRIAEFFGVECPSVLTGFKWIARQMEDFEKKGIEFVMGFEESYGFLIETEVRDKDAVSAAMLICEIALYCRSRKMTIIDYLTDIFAQFGFFEEFAVSKYFQGESGARFMAELMEDLRKNPPKELADIPVVRILDYKSGVNGLPVSNVLQYYLEDGSVVSVRPSGTEPKIKFYCTTGVKQTGTVKETEELLRQKVKKIESAITAVLDK